MCGICGVVSSRRDSKEIVQHMTRALRHRGPDGDGIASFEVTKPGCQTRDLALGHTRLAIIDLSDAGRQPMANEDETVWIVFNGEIYNFLELRDELERLGHRFRSNTDTEVILHLYEQMGAAALPRLNGMFAFGLVDLRNHRFLLARDPIGIKPLYYSALPQHFLFGSEIKAILASGTYRPQPDWQAICDYFTYLYVPCPHTAFEHIRQLPPAHYLEMSLPDGKMRLERYWQVSHLEGVEAAPLAELERQGRALLTDSVRRQLISDVPLGIFLSGGVDSTIVAGLAREVHANIRTFTVVFPDRAFGFYNEQESARAIARHLKTQHTEIPVREISPLKLLSLIEYFDQPFGNPTFYLMYLISKAAREHITVALCGAGGDELYAGYPRYQAAQWAKRLAGVPRPILHAGRHVLGLLRDSYRTMDLRRLRQFLEGLDGDFVRQFCKWTYHFGDGQKGRLLHGLPGFNGKLEASERFLRDAIEQSPFPDPDNRLLHTDVQTFLVNNLLEYTDKMSMSAALEVRVPLLDPRFVEFSLSVPFRHKLQAKRSKVLLKTTFSEFFPADLRTGPKRGFNVPLAHWMMSEFDAYFKASQDPGHPLRGTLGLDMGITWREGMLDWGAIQQLRNQHRLGRRDNSYELFAIIMFDVWWQKYIAGGLPKRSAAAVGTR